MENYLERSISYGGYLALLDELVAKGATTGPDQSGPLAEFTKLNRHRMRRLDKMLKLTDEAAAEMAAAGRAMIWLVITEGWCGDAAQNIPVIEKLAAASDKIETRYVLRDENLELMDRFLTGGARAIPKLIALDARTLEVLGSWGARPAAAQELYLKLKHEGVAKSEIMEALQRWYLVDEGRSAQHEFIELIGQWGRGIEAAGASV